MVSYAIVGVSRGIGREYVRQLASRSDATVFAIVRNASTSTHLASTIAAMKNVHVLEADFTDYLTLKAAAQTISAITGGKLDCLVHNAARVDAKTIVLGFDDFASMNDLDDEFITAYKTNALRVVHSIIAFLPLLRASAAPLRKIVVIGTGGADPKSVKAIGIPNMVAYGMSKAAGLMATTKWALTLRDEHFVVISMAPGLVDTLGTVGACGDAATRELFTRFSEDSTIVVQSPEESVAAQLKIVDSLQPSHNGLFLNYSGEEYNVQ